MAPELTLFLDELGRTKHLQRIRKRSQHHLKIYD